MMIKTFFWPDEAATQQWANNLTQYWLQNKQAINMLICLHGDLGAGKTTFVRYLLRNLGVQGRIKSPTFAIVESYDTTISKLWHFDLYRFDNPQEWADAGFSEICATNGIKLIEWAEKAADYLPQADWDIYLTQPDADATDARKIQVQAHSQYGKELLGAIYGK